MGGLARRVSYVRKKVQMGQAAVFVDAGGFAEHGMYAALKNRFLLRAYAVMGYQAVNLAEADLRACGDSLLSQAQAWGVPFVTCNLKYADGRDLPYARRYVVLHPWGEGKGAVGVFGVALQDMPAIGRATQTWWRKEDPVVCARGVVAQLRKKCDLIIALVYGQDSDAARFAKEVPGVDVVIAGVGTYNIRGPESANGSVLCVNGTQGKYIGDVTLEREPGGREWKASAGELFPLDSEVREDPQVAKIVEEYDKALREELRTRPPAP